MANKLNDDSDFQIDRGTITPAGMIETGRVRWLEATDTQGNRILVNLDNCAFVAQPSAEFILAGAACTFVMSSGMLIGARLPTYEAMHTKLSPATVIEIPAKGLKLQ